MHVINTDIEIWKVFGRPQDHHQMEPHTNLWTVAKELPVENSLLTYLFSKDRKSK